MNLEGGLSITDERDLIKFLTHSFKANPTHSINQKEKDFLSTDNNK
jgi:hypothetical protein